MSPRKVLVTGGAGFVGSYVVRRLLRDGRDVVYDSFIQYSVPDGHRVQPNFAVRLKDVQDGIRIVRGNTLDIDNLRRVIVAEHPEVIIHMDDEVLYIAHAVRRSLEESSVGKTSTCSDRGLTERHGADESTLGAAAGR